MLAIGFTSYLYSQLIKEILGKQNLNQYDHPSPIKPPNELRDLMTRPFVFLMSFKSWSLCALFAHHVVESVIAFK